MQLPTIKEMIAVGAHFGHKKDKCHPRARALYSFGSRNGIYIIDLDKTKIMLEEALNYISKLIKERKVILFVGTKRQAKDAIKKTAEEAEMPYINSRWLGGMLTNFSTIHANIKKLKDLEAAKLTSAYENLTKQEKSRFEKNLAKLQLNLGGIKNLGKLPDAIFIVDIVDEKVAVAEAQINNIPIIGICDVNANPDLISYPIPANDDSKPTIEMILNIIKERIIEIRKEKPTHLKKTDE